MHHLPDLTSFNDIISLLFVLNVATLGHILYRPFYFEPFSVTEGMYQAWAHGRELAMEILEHINGSQTFWMDKREVSFRPIVQAFLSHQIRYLVTQVKVQERSATGGGSHVLSSGKFIETIAVAFSKSNWLLDSLATHRRFRRPADHYEWYDNSNYTVSSGDNGRVVNGSLQLHFP